MNTVTPVNPGSRTAVIAQIRKPNRRPGACLQLVTEAYRPPSTGTDRWEMYLAAEIAAGRIAPPSARNSTWEKDIRWLAALNADLERLGLPAHDSPDC